MVRGLHFRGPHFEGFLSRLSKKCMRAIQTLAPVPGRTSVLSGKMSVLISNKGPLLGHRSYQCNCPAAARAKIVYLCANTAGLIHVNTSLPVMIQII